MAKKINFGLEALMHKYFQDFLSFLFSSVEGGIGDSLKKFSNFAHFKKKMKNYIVATIIAIAGILLIAFGLGTFIESFIVIWKPGIVYVLLGIVFILIALIYKKFK